MIDASGSKQSQFLAVDDDALHTVELMTTPFRGRVNAERINTESRHTIRNSSGKRRDSASGRKTGPS